MKNPFEAQLKVCKPIGPVNLDKIARKTYFNTVLTENDKYLIFGVVGINMSNQEPVITVEKLCERDFDILFKTHRFLGDVKGIPFFASFDVYENIDIMAMKLRINEELK